MSFFDTHCHLAGQEMRPQSEYFVAQALSKNVRGFSIISAEEDCLCQAPIVAERLKVLYPHAVVLYSAGIHPHDAKKCDSSLRDLIVRQATRAAAIGETGLDYYYEHSDKEVQKDVFAFHIELAKQMTKPLIIHCRQAADDILLQLRVHQIQQHSNPGIFHCFAEDWSVAKQVLDLGFYISFSGIITFKNAQALREVVKQVPLERLLIETDSPWLAPVPHRGQRNQPAFVADVFAALVALRSEDAQQLEHQLWQNSLKVFGVL